MFTPLALYIGLRYTRAKKRNHFVSFISLSSMLGIGLGVMVLITVLSVMSGFDAEIHTRFFGMAPEITVNGRDGKITDWQALETKLTHVLKVKAVAPFIGGQGLLANHGQVMPIILTGILPEQEEKITELRQKLLVGNLADLHHFGIILGRSMADDLGVLVGDKVSILIPQVTSSIAGMIPRVKRFTVVGIFSAGSGFAFDTKLGFINLYDAQKLMQLGNSITGLKLKIDNVYEAPVMSEIVAKVLGANYFVSNWTDQAGAFFQAVKMEKTMMFFILLLIIAVAAFNLVSSLVMVVNDKQAEIAIMRTLGMMPRTILCIFIVQGMIVGIVGTLLGLISGLLLASHATEIVNALQSFFHIQLFTSNAYFVDYLPSKIVLEDVVTVSMIALLMSFGATIYPAWRASRTVIAEALHYE